ncbi:GntR family transcriptional regulator [Nocardia arthritidis]|uniref:FCD domain-containing protein n=1 Tax=Nocardia arthritidis TaxID=228602 RepID=A0A6G9YBT5_9NOCA|nr:GntR family transcriptional regulator [Nocardia arthritidis]QIS10689.1 FCD domain-containing protein [Nocardia arthritidis]
MDDTAGQVPAVDQVLHEIRRRVIGGELAPGAAIAARTLTEQLGVGELPVREALRQLRTQGLLSSRPARGTVLCALDAHDLESIYRLRISIEPELAAESVPLLTPADLARLQRLLDATFRTPITERSWAHDREFHELPLRPAATEWDLRTVHALWDAADRFTRLTFDPIDAAAVDVDRHRRRHQAIVDAACDRDAYGVRTAVRIHLMENAAEARAILGGVSCG